MCIGLNMSGHIKHIQLCIESLIDICIKVHINNNRDIITDFGVTLCVQVNFMSLIIIVTT